MFKIKDLAQSKSFGGLGLGCLLCPVARLFLSLLLYTAIHVLSLISFHSANMSVALVISLIFIRLFKRLPLPTN
jgi:hypothetical protein